MFVQARYALDSLISISQGYPCSIPRWLSNACSCKHDMRLTALSRIKRLTSYDMSLRGLFII